MAFIWPALATVGAALISSSSQKKANQANIEAARETTEVNVEEAQKTRDFNADQARISREFNAEEANTGRVFSAGQAERQMGFQEQMANTSYQRAVGDMSAAGLNPMLAYHQGGAATPSGASGSSGNASSSSASGPTAQGVTPRIESQYSGAISSALGAAATIASVEKTRAETEEVKARTETELARPENVRSQTAVNTTQLTRMDAEVERIGYQNDLTREEILKVRQEVHNLVSAQETDAAKRFLTIVEATHKDLDIPRALNEARTQDTWWKKNIAPFIKDFQGIGNSGVSLERVFRGFRR